VIAVMLNECRLWIIGSELCSVRILGLLTHPMTNHPFFNDLYPHTNIEYYFAKNVGIVQLKITAYNGGLTKRKDHRWNLKYYKIIN
jgi:hypothetical protein